MSVPSKLVAVMTILVPVALLGACAQQPPPPAPVQAAPPPAPVPAARGWAAARRAARLP